MALSERQIENAATKAVQDLGYATMKPEQLQVVSGVLRGRDVFGILPTGFGKSLCFACLPSVYDQLFPSSDPSIVVVVTPLTAIMKDQAGGAELVEGLLVRLALACKSPSADQVAFAGTIESKPLAAFASIMALLFTTFS